MNRFFKYGSVALTAVLALVLGSCTDEYEYTPAPMPDNACITLSAEETNIYFEGAQEDQSFTFNVNRPDSLKDNAVTVSLVCDNEKVVLPETVTIEAGETTKEVTATCSLAKGEKAVVSVSASEADANVYSEKQYIVITLERDKYAWITCGKAMFADYTFSDGASAEVEIQRCEGEDVENTYKLVQPFTAVYGEGTGDVKFEMNTDGTIKNLITDGDVIATLGGYDYYFNTTSYAAYCNFEKTEDGIYVVNTLLKKGSSLYTGGQFIFVWTEGYPF